MTAVIPPEAITAAQIAYEAYARQAEADYAATATDPAFPPEMKMRSWQGLPPNLQAAWQAAANTGERPVFVIAIGHDLGDDDAARIQQAVVEALRKARAAAARAVMP